VEPADLSSYLQGTATGPYPEPNGSNLYPQPVSLKSILIPSSHLRLGLPSGLFTLGFPTKTLYTFLSSVMHATCSSLMRLYIYLYFTSLDLYPTVSCRSHFSGRRCKAQAESSSCIGAPFPFKHAVYPQPDEIEDMYVTKSYNDLRYVEGKLSF
jgi:hypothetical protein